jgi:hypothetical protein
MTNCICNKYIDIFSDKMATGTMSPIMMSLTRRILQLLSEYVPNKNSEENMLSAVNKYIKTLTNYQLLHQIMKNTNIANLKQTEYLITILQAFINCYFPTNYLDENRNEKKLLLQKLKNNNFPTIKPSDHRNNKLQKRLKK